MWKIILISIVLLISLSSVIDASTPTPSYQNQELHYSFTVPNDWIQIPRSVIEETAARASEMSNGPTVVYEAAFQAPSETYFSYPYLLVQHLDLDSTTIDQIANALEDVGETQSVSELKQLDWFNDAQLGKPVVDKELKAVLTRIENTVPNLGVVQGISAWFPGRTGMVTVNCYSLAPDFDLHLSEFQSIFHSFGFEEGYEYSWVTATANRSRPLFSRAVDQGIAGAIVGAILGLLGLGISVVRRIGKRGSQQ